MKKFLLVLQFLFFISHCSFSQGIGIGNNDPDPSAALDITNTSKGLLIPRMSTAAINVIAGPAKGLLVYDSSTNQLMANAGTTVAPHWLAVASNGNAWNLSGNSNTNPATQFIGTTDNKPLRFRVNNIQAGELDAVTGSVSLGLRSGQNNATGFNNIAIGKDALRSNKAGFGLVAIGDSALFNNDNDNPSPGIFATSNTAVGSKALFSNDFGSNNTATGSNALSTNTHGNLNSAYGASSLSSNINGGFNTAIGGNALSSNTIGNFNTSIGAMSLLFNFNGHNNTATGVFSLTANTAGNDNTAAGVRSLTSNTTGNFNSAFGSQSLFFNQTGNGNTAIGDSSLFSNTTGNGNTASGFRALGLNKDGQENTAIGSNALNSAFHSSGNTAVGVEAGSGFVLGSGNTLIGAGADVGGDNIFNAVALGKAARCTANNQVRLGNTFTTSIGGIVGFTNISDGRFKKYIQEAVKGIDFIMKLRPVTYQLDIAGLDKKLNVNGKTNTRLGNGMNENAQTIFSGFIAQEVEDAAKATGYDFSGVDKPKNENDIYGLRYAEFVVPLVKAMQEQQQMILELKKQNTDLLNRILLLEKISK